MKGRPHYGKEKSSDTKKPIKILFYIIIEVAYDNTWIINPFIDVPYKGDVASIIICHQNKLWIFLYYYY